MGFEHEPYGFGHAVTEDRPNDCDHILHAIYRIVVEDNGKLPGLFGYGSFFQQRAYGGLRIRMTYRVVQEIQPGGIHRALTV